MLVCSGTMEKNADNIIKTMLETIAPFSMGFLNTALSRLVVPWVSSCTLFLKGICLIEVTQRVLLA